MIMFVQDANDLTAHLAQLGDVLFRVGKLGFGIKVSLFIRHLEHVVNHHGDAASPQAPHPRQHKDDAGFHLGADYVQPFEVLKVLAPIRLPKVVERGARTWVAGIECVG